MGEGSVSGFKHTVSMFADGEIPLNKYKSESTGISVCIANVPGPVVTGYICFATEAHDDDGLPHTLEHLIFMGSENYPYKGVLDRLACRVAAGTNAHTATDCTWYDLFSAGSEGFLKLLPAYIDHLLYPTLTDSAFVTEVHHINSEGEDAGVVYCEIQGFENSAEHRCYQSMLRAMYPGDCGYKSETGGIMKNLRESTTNQKIRAYHKEFYRPENMCIIIVGQIDAKEVFEVLHVVEEQIKKKGPRTPFTRPWQTPVPPLMESVTLDIEYPCDEDEFGMVMASWRGPEAKNYSELIALQILMQYLTDTSISPLQRDFVECADPFCNEIEYDITEHSVSFVSLNFANVPVDKLGLIKRELLCSLEKIASGIEELDMKRMTTVIHKKKLNILSGMESNPANQLLWRIKGDFLYGSTPEDLQQRVQRVPIIEKFLNENADFWRDLLKSYIVDGNFVFVSARPSSKFSKDMADEEKKRVAEQREALGPEGLKKTGEILAKAIEQNEMPMPVDVINSVSLASVQRIKFHDIKRYADCMENSTEKPEDFDLEKMPLPCQLDIVKSSFVRMYILLDTSKVPNPLRMYLPLFVELLLESPICQNGEVIPYQEVVKQLADDTISVSVSIGLNYSRFSCSLFAQVMCLRIMVEEERYLKGVQWIRDLLLQTIFEPSRIKTIAAKMISDVASMRRKGLFIAETIMKNLCFCSQSNHWATSMMRQQNFLNMLLKTLASNPDEVVEALNNVREVIVKTMTVHLATNLPSLKQKCAPEDPWQSQFLSTSVEPIKTKFCVKHCYELTEDPNSKLPTEVVIGVGSVESAFLLLSAPCINSFTHPDYPALLVLMEYLQQCEGPMWRYIRGLGLAYGYSIYVCPNEGMIYFMLYRSTLVIKAYEEAQRLIESHLDHTIPWDPLLLVSARGSLIFNIVRKEKSIADVVKQSVVAYFKGVDFSFTKELLENISQVTFQDMERVGNLYLRPLFKASLSKCAICCHPSKVDDNVNGFKQFSRDLTVVSSLEELFLTQY